MPDFRVPGAMGMKILPPELWRQDPNYWNGRLAIYLPPDPQQTFVLGVDPAEGVGADRSVIQVLRLGTVDYPDEQAAEFASDYISPVDFADIVNTVGRFYGSGAEEAFCAVEANVTCGQLMINDLRSRYDYTNQFVWKAYDRVQNIYTNKFGWWTSKTTRPALVARGTHALVNDDLIVHSEELIKEMSDFRMDFYEGKAQARKGRHDDRIMALFIAYFCGHDEEWNAGDDVAEERRLKREGKVAIAEVARKSNVVPDFHNRVLTSDEYEEHLESSVGWLAEWAEGV